MTTVTNQGRVEIVNAKSLEMPSGLVSSISTQEAVFDRLMAVLGNPTLPVELAPDYVSDVLPALYKYYSYLPIQKPKYYNLIQTYREVHEDMDTLTQGLFPNDDKYFFLGVLNYQIRNMIGQGRFDEYLLGFNYSIPSYDPERILLQDTLIDINTGDPIVNCDFASKKINIVVGGACYLNVDYAFGHYDLNKIPLRHVELLALLIGQSYYQRLIAIRTSASFGNDDFSLSAELLNNTLAMANERGNQMLKDLGLMAFTRG